MMSFNPEHERLIAEAIRAGLIRTPGEAVEPAMEELRQRLTARQSHSATVQAIERLESFGKRHGLSLGGLTIKDLVNEGRP